MNDVMDCRHAQGELGPRLQTVVDLLPKHRWQVKPAAIEAGYSESYAQRLATISKGNVNFRQAVERQRREIARAEGWTKGRWLREATIALERARDRNDGSTEAQMIRQIGQYVGAFERDNSQRAETGLAALAKLVLEARGQRSLSGPVPIDADIVDRDQPDEQDDQAP